MKDDELSKKYLYVYVEYEDDKGGKLYCYRSDDDTLKKGDRVLVDRAGFETTARIINKVYYDYFDVPYPLDKTKYIIDKVSEEFDPDFEIYDDDGDSLYNTIDEYHNLLLNNMFGKLQIKRLIKLIAPKNGPAKDTLYFYPRFNMFFYKNEEKGNYFLAEYNSKLITNEMFRIIEKDSIKVPQNGFALTTEGENYTKSVKFCKDNNLEYYDDTDILEFIDEKEKLDGLKNDYIEPKEFTNIDEIIDYLKNYKEAKFCTPEPSYYIENNTIVHFFGYIDYDLRIFKIPDFLKENNYISEEYYNRKDYPEFFNEDYEKWDFEKLDIKRLSYFILRMFYLERMNEGLINRLAIDGYLLKAVKRLKILGNPIEKDLMFEYSLEDAEMFPIQKVSIYNKEKDNVIFEDRVITIKEKDLISIIDILNNNLIYKIDKIKMPDILDGSYNKFYFSNGIYSNTIDCYNIWYYRDNDEYEDVKIIINVFNNISNILKKYGIKLSLGG